VAEGKTMSKKTLILSLGLLAGLAFSSSLLAQPWERVYGPKDMKDEGHRRVTPVVRCPGRGYIAIGSRNSASEVYLVRTSNAGATLWEKYFDVGADGQPDEGFSLVELRDGSGFVTTGSSTRGLQKLVHVMKVDCDGSLRQSFFYFPPFSTVATRAIGHDIREAVVGNGVDTNPGDLLIAGWIEFGGSQADAFLMRLDAGFNIIWNLRYDVGAVERFYGLTEARPNAVGGGDIIAVGDLRESFTLQSQALAMRVDGNTGLITGGDHCMAHYGDAGEENFQSVVEMRIQPQTGALTMAGLSTSPGQLQDVYLVQTKASPCSLLAQTTIGNDNGIYDEYAMDLIEVLIQTDPSLGVPVGSLALTGGAEANQTRQDAFLLFADQTLLSPLAARRYGDHRGSVDFGTSLQQIQGALIPVPRGFIIAGTTFTDWDGSADPQDLYLIQPNAAASTGCEERWHPKHEDWLWEPKRLDPHTFKVFEGEEVHTKEYRDDTVVRVCN
jgi:hypothetical protein